MPINRLVTTLIALQLGTCFALASASPNPPPAPLDWAGANVPPELKFPPPPLPDPKIKEAALKIFGPQDCKDYPLCHLDQALVRAPTDAGVRMMYALNECKKPGPTFATDVNYVLTHPTLDQLGLIGPGDLRNLRVIAAKIDLKDGHPQLAIAKLWGVIKSDPEAAFDFGSGEVKPVQSSPSPCEWTLADFDKLIEFAPNDYRPYVMKAAYISFFRRFQTTKEAGLDADIPLYRKAIKLNTNSALTYFLMGKVLSSPSMYFPTSDTTSAIPALKKALEIDPKLWQAHLELAGVYSSLKKYREEVLEATAAIDAGHPSPLAYELASEGESGLGNIFSAIDHISKAIDIESKAASLNTTNLQQDLDTRATLYAKQQMWSHAINDLSKEISLELPELMFFNLQSILEMYPELNEVPDKILLNNLHRIIMPSVSQVGFLKQLASNKTNQPNPNPDIFIKRSEAYARSGNLINSARDFRRALVWGGSTWRSYIDGYARWVSIAENQEIDLKTAPTHLVDGTAIVWLRSTDPKTDAYTLSRLEVDCGSGMLKRLTSQGYAANGSAMGFAGGRSAWAAPIPSSIGERLQDDYCRH